MKAVNAKKGVYLKTTYKNAGVNFRPWKLVEKLEKFDKNEQVRISFKGVGSADLQFTVGEYIEFLNDLISCTEHRNITMVAMLEGVKFEITSVQYHDPTYDIVNGMDEYDWESRISSGELPEQVGEFDIEYRFSKEAKAAWKANGGSGSKFVSTYRFAK